MSTYLLSPPAVTSVAVQGSDSRFPVRRIVCVGRNYADHAREMGNDDRDPPFFFFKPTDTLIDSGVEMPYPSLTKLLHHEVELVVAIGKGGTDIDVGDALGHVYGYAVGLDMTRRDIQLAARDVGRPWDWGKGFDLSAPCAPLSRVSDIGHLSKGAISLRVNGEVRQASDLSQLIWGVPEIIAIASQGMALRAGDLIFTGTPAGVSAVSEGDLLEGVIAGLEPVVTRVGPRSGGLR
ncbi:fumarylacetoacetate hydrolase family protein [Pseudorhodoferax sp. Leaf265]|uniref:fumarylacetoacetate hydrolase family protein n=1 Tax=Pseudorhodoferax sp. Leaf265 TaxID=1736315 RepID=UPI0006F2D52A|nr:fumarylacetoacetate hydrolase family protein [Pseudorhodoferax sp. Leaf265]KQP19329.1 fumarylacetoacetate hydrolase [Pseudorhodoferax sp. Leaf265]